MGCGVTRAFNGSVVLTALAFAIAPLNIATAGPPFATDDPEPTDYGHFETYLFTQGVTAGSGKSGPELGLEVNYGALPDLQISASLPVGFSAPNRTGMAIEVSDVEFGVKYRFVEEDNDGWRPQVSFYPSVQFAPTTRRTAGRRNFYRSGHRRASEIGRPSAAAAIASIPAAARAIPCSSVGHFCVGLVTASSWEPRFFAKQRKHKEKMA